MEEKHNVFSLDYEHNLSSNPSIAFWKVRTVNIISPIEDRVLSSYAVSVATWTAHPGFLSFLVIRGLTVFSKALYLWIPDFLFQWTWGSGNGGGGGTSGTFLCYLPWLSEHNVGSVSVSCLLGNRELKSFFNIATQMAVYHLKYRVQSEEKGHKGHYALVAKDLSLFSFYSMPTNRLLKDKIGNSPLCSFWGLLYMISATWGKERRLYEPKPCVCQGLLGPPGCPQPMTLCSLLAQSKFPLFLILTWNIFNPVPEAKLASRDWNDSVSHWGKRIAWGFRPGGISAFSEAAFSFICSARTTSVPLCRAAQCTAACLPLSTLWHLCRLELN